jgi:hypothetical protein
MPVETGGSKKRPPGLEEEPPVATEALQRFHLILEPAPVTEPGEVACSVPTATALEVPDGPVQLQVRLGQPPRLLTFDGHPEEDALLLETIEPDRRPSLILLRLGRSDARLNGQPSPRVAVLTRGDLLGLDHEWSLRVNVYHRSRVGPANPEQAGKLCQICRTPIQPSSRIYACLCGAVMHLENANEVQGRETLECAGLGTECRVCNRPVILTEGYEAESEHAC